MMCRMTREPRLPAPWAAVLMGWLTVVLLVDADGTLTQQRVLGVLTWVVLAVALTRVSPVVRVQTGVVVAFATVVEYVCSPTLEVYLYRFHNVPAYVPPGHGLVYLAAFALGHALWVQRHQRVCMAVAVVGLGAWAGWALLQPHPDVLGALWFLCLVGFLWVGPSRAVYLGAAVVVTWLEIVGTELGTWTWQPRDPWGWVSIGNPPTGAAGGYGWFDLAGLLAAPYLLAAWASLRAELLRSSPRSRRPDADPQPADAAS
jgi:hypothetical protein